MPEADKVAALLALVAPGFIILGIRQQFLTSPPKPIAESVLGYAAISAGYFFLAKPLGVFVQAHWPLVTQPYREAVIYCILPVVIGVAYSWLAEKEVVRWAWNLIRLSPVHHVPSAWDFAFRKQREATFVIVTLTDGTQVAGLYGEGAFASSSKEERDLLVSSVYEIAPTGAWQEAVPSRSMLLCGKNIQAVEIY